VSRFESDAATPDLPTARALARLYRATVDERRRLIELCTALEQGSVDSRLVMQRGKNRHFQERIREIERSAGQVRSYQPGMVLGTLQTPAYARAVFNAPRPTRPPHSDSPEDLSAIREARYHQLATDTTRTRTFIQTEGALNWWVGTAQDMVEQMERLTEASHLPHVRLGIIPLRTPSRVFAPHGFHIYDSRAVMIGTKTATALTHDERDIQTYQDLFFELESMAVFDAPARDILQRTAEEYAHAGTAVQRR
jgi:hypothetical protein